MHRSKKINLTPREWLIISIISFQIWGIFKLTSFWDNNQKETAGKIPIKYMSLTELRHEAIAITKGRNIFFLETNKSKTFFDQKLHCAFESAALQNPSYTIFVVLGRHSRIGHKPGFLGQIPNLVYTKVNLGVLFSQSPLKTLWHRKEIQHSRFSLNNISDCLRLIFLYKFGGVYIDSDIIMLHRFPTEATNWVIRSGQHLNNAFLKFERGHNVLRKALEQIVIHTLKIFHMKLLHTLLFIGTQFQG